MKHKQNELQNFGYNQWEKMNQLFTSLLPTIMQLLECQNFHLLVQSNRTQYKGNVSHMCNFKLL